MVYMSGICAVLAMLTLLTRSLTPRRRRNLALTEFAASLLLAFDRFAYQYHGDPSTTGYWMVRLSNFMVYFLSLFLAYRFTQYLCDLYTNEGGLPRVPKRLHICMAICAVGVVLVVISQFTGLYYTIDAQNVYHRAPLFPICLAIPTLIVLIQLSVILQYRGRLSRAIEFSLVMYTVVPVIAAVVQLFTYGLSLINLSMAVMAALLYAYALIDLNQALEQAKQREIEIYRTERQKEHAMFEQTAEALVNAIDAKDSYTNGHSQRVAEYSRAIARAVGKPEAECEEIYFAALLHDVGKIGIPVSILNKKGRLNDEEFARIKQHPVLGGQILASIHQSPYLSVTARYHHERYDGKGYPEGLVGEDIPEIARIVAVADAYDAMSSNRSYRTAIPQHLVREELVKGTGIQFDPGFARAMIHLLDLDVEYHMREKEKGANLSQETELRCENLYHDCTEGIPVTRKPVRIHLQSNPDEGCAEGEGLPTLILFDALDGKVHPGEENNKDLLYFEYARIRLDGHVDEGGTRRVEVRPAEEDPAAAKADEPGRYHVEAVRIKDHARVRITHGSRATDVILALPDCSRFVYLSIGGERCTVSGIRVENDETPAAADAIPRIAEEISFIKGCPEGDIPNVQVDNWRTEASEGVPVGVGLALTFHTMSLPTARLVWHCPFISLYYSDDGQIDGPNFREYILMRLDGENWYSADYVENRISVHQTPDFKGWKDWKERHKQGLDCAAVIERQGDKITIRTENLGLSVSSVTTILDGTKDVYVALTGDQCAITNIRVSRGWNS